MCAMASQFTGVSIVCSIVGVRQRKLQSPASLSFVRGIHRWSADSHHKGSVTWKMSPYDDVIIDIASKRHSTPINEFRKIAFLLTIYTASINFYWCAKTMAVTCRALYGIPKMIGKFKWTFLRNEISRELSFWVMYECGATFQWPILQWPHWVPFPISHATAHLPCHLALRPIVGLSWISSSDNSHFLWLVN